MELKEISVESIKLWEPAARLPMSDADLLSSAWRAIPTVRGMGLAVTVIPSAKHPGFVHYEVWYFGTGEAVTSKKPVYPSHVADFLNFELQRYSLNAQSLRWQQCDAAAPDRQRDDCRAEANTECVYFLGAGPFVKIGKATGHPASRIADLRTGCPFPITLLASVAGGLTEEFALHKRFATYRTHGEWFRHEGELAEHIKSLAEANA